MESQGQADMLHRNEASSIARLNVKALTFKTAGFRRKQRRTDDVPEAGLAKLRGHRRPNAEDALGRVDLVPPDGPGPLARPVATRVSATYPVYREHNEDVLLRSGCGNGLRRHTEDACRSRYV
eukprot:3391678-Pleurochrysis_carterae.AAC.2